VDLSGPFLQQLMQLSGQEIEGALKAAAEGTSKVQIALGRVRRYFVQPLQCARIIESNNCSIPAAFEIDKHSSLLLVDSVLSCGEFSFLLGEGAQGKLGAKLKASMVGKLGANRFVASNSKVSITGASRVSFAFTCLEVRMNDDRRLTSIKFPENVPHLGATEVGIVQSISHTLLGGRNELITFDN
jgi:hypothetical protein